jgi:predicted nucleic acid-binding protein
MPSQDVLLAVVAMDYDAELWTRDAHFTVIRTVSPKLKLFAGPTG